MGQGDVTEVMACGAALHATEADEVTVINERPVLHLQMLSSTNALSQDEGGWQAFSC